MSLRRGLAHDEEQEQKKSMAAEGKLAPLPDKAKIIGLTLVQAGKLHPHPSMYRDKSDTDPLSRKHSASQGSLPAVPDAMLKTGALSASTPALPSARMSDWNHSLGSSRSGSRGNVFGHHPADAPGWT